MRPVLGRLINASDDGPQAAGVVVLTHRFWTTEFKSDPSVIGKTVQAGFARRHRHRRARTSRSRTRQETEIIANVVTSPHHLSATMVTGRVHRMTELFGRLAPGADVEAARADLRAAHGAILREHPEVYSAKADFRIDAVQLRDQITAPARTVLLVLLAASALVFVIACSNVANLILARSVRREGELAVRAALGARASALRRTLLAESLLLCGTGAVLGVLMARPMVAVLSRYAARFSVRALDVTVDSSLLWIGVGLALVAATLLAFVPRLPSAEASSGFGLSNGSARLTTGTNRRLRVFAVLQIAASFVLLAGAGMLLTTLLELQTAQLRLNTSNVLALHVPVISGREPDQVTAFYHEVLRRIWRASRGGAGRRRHAGAMARGRRFRPGLSVLGRGLRQSGRRRRSTRALSHGLPGFFAALGVPLIAGRDFNESDRRDAEKVVIVSQSLAQRMFPNQDAVNRHLTWTDPVMKFIDVSPEPRRIVGVVADVDDENVVPGPAVTIYHPLGQAIGGGRLFVHARTRSVRARATDHAHHPGALRRSAGREGGHARRRARRGAGAESTECAGVRRLCRRRAPDRHRRRGGRARLLGERAHARVRHSARDWVRTERSAAGRREGRRDDRGRGNRGGGRRAGLR